MQRIMVATDGSQGANHAVEVAARLATAFGAALKIVHVAEASLSERAAAEARRLGLSPGEAIDAGAERVLVDAERRARHVGAAKVEVQLCTGDPAQTLIDMARRDQIETLVVGRRGHGRLAGLLLGSVSSKLANLAPCNVMIVPE
jgi:nucleotide-binding universal stress UspA family protein